jgi:FixJ family two-component response regulator
MSTTSTHRHAHPPDPEVIALLDQVEDRDRALLAMLLESSPDDDIAATLGISGAAVRRRRARLLDRLVAVARSRAPRTSARRGVSRAGPSAG